VQGVFENEAVEADAQESCGRKMLGLGFGD
jgi:hypothetical protein